MKLLLFIVLTISLELNSKSLYDFEEKIYTIQIFSSKNKTESKAFLLEYLDYGNSFIWPKLINDQIWYRGCVGVFFSKEDAEKKLELIKLKRKESFIMELVSN